MASSPTEGAGGLKQVSEEVFAEFTRIARKLHKSGHHLFGFLPSRPTVPVPPLLTQLGSALAQISGTKVGVVDANIRWPATAPELIAEGDEEQLFVVRWLTEWLAIFVPRAVGPVGAGVPQLGYLIRSNRETIAHFLVDLTGFERLGDHLGAVELLDAALIVGRRGETRERDLLRFQHYLPKSKNLGVVLVG